MTHHAAVPDRPDPSDPFEMDDAAYVLGALSPAERQRFEQHLVTCDACRRSVTELAGLPGILRRVPAEAVQSMDDDGSGPDASGPPPALLAEVLDRGAQEERRERRVRAVRWASALTTAAAAVVVGVLAFVLPGPDDGPPLTGATPPAVSAPPSATLTFEPLVDTDLSAQVSLRDVAWGTKIQVACAYPQGEDQDGGADVAYSLVVHGADGSSEQVATWNAVAGRELTIDAATAVRGDDIASLEIRAEDGTPLLATPR